MALSRWSYSLQSCFLGFTFGGEAGEVSPPPNPSPHPAMAWEHRYKEKVPCPGLCHQRCQPCLLPPGNGDSQRAGRAGCPRGGGGGDRHMSFIFGGAAVCPGASLNFTLPTLRPGPPIP